MSLKPFEQKETLLTLLDIINLKYQIDTSVLKLSIIEKQVDYFNMLKIIGTSNKAIDWCRIRKLRV